MLTRRDAMKRIGGAAASILIPQDYQMPEDMKGKRKKVRPEDLRSGTLYGQYQLRGSVLTIKDASTTASGYMAFGTDMTTIPTSATTGTGIYIDYTGIYGLASNVQQAYMRASDGKIIAGAGAVTLDDDGISITQGTTDVNAIKWYQSTTKVAEIRAKGTNTEVDIHSFGGSGATASVINLLAGVTNTVALDMYGDGTASRVIISGQSGTFAGVSIGPTGTPESLLHLKSAAPSFRMQDSTASAKSLLLTVDANYATFEEVGGNDLLKLDLANLSVILGNAALATTATDGFLYIPACAGAPTGVPTAVTGRIPLVVDSTNSKMYIYSGGAWVALN